MEIKNKEFNRSASHHLSIGDLIRLSLRIFKTKPLRTFLTILGMSFGIGAVLFLVSLGYGLQYILIGKLVTTEDSLITVEAFYPAESELVIEETDLENILKLEEAAEISPVAEYTAEMTHQDITGLILTKIVEPNYFRLAGIKPDIGETFKDNEPGVVFSNAALQLTGIYKDFSNFFKKDLDKEFEFKVFYQEGEEFEFQEAITTKPLKLKGIIEDELEPPFAIIPARFLDKSPKVFKRILVKATEIDKVESLRDKLVEKGFLISARVDLVKQATKVMKIITTILGVFGVTALIVAAVGMFNTMIVSFLERIYEVGIIKSLGATDKDVKHLFLMESLIMGLLGGLGGVLLGIGSGELANFGLALLAKKLGGQPFDLFITPWWFVGVIIISSSIIGLLSGFWPAFKASRLSPKAAFLRK